LRIWRPAAGQRARVTSDASTVTPAIACKRAPIPAAERREPDRKVHSDSEAFTEQDTKGYLVQLKVATDVPFVLSFACTAQILD
jgi:hypothetical protein